MPMRRHSGAAGGVSPPPAQRSDEATSLSDLIAGLADLDANGLRLQWRNHLGGTPPAHLPRWLLLRVLTLRPDSPSSSTSDPRSSDSRARPSAGLRRRHGRQSPAEPGDHLPPFSRASRSRLRPLLGRRLGGA